MDTSFQLAIELSNVFPVKDVVRAVGTLAWNQATNLARSLKKTGSDLTVEYDLAIVFGRGLVDVALEKTFRERVLHETNILPVHGGPSELMLSAGPGPTVSRAFTSDDPIYIRTVIQLSLLGYLHGRTGLASALSDALARRFDMKVHDAKPDPGYDSIFGTLEACSSQTSAFAWSNYIQNVEKRIREHFPNYRHSPEHISLSPNALFAALDYLFIVQKWPEERKMLINKQTGVITMLIWAHYVLGLSVAIKGMGSGDLVFTNSDEREPQVLIQWTDSHDPQEVYLLDSQMQIVLRTESEEVTFAYLKAVERLPLRNFGTTLLMRDINSSNITMNESRILQVRVARIVALALMLVERMGRSLDRGPDQIRVPSTIQPWQIFDAAALVFDQIPCDKTIVQQYLRKRQQHSTISELVNQINGNADANSTDRDLSCRSRIVQFASFLIVMASVSGISDCGELPVIADIALLERVSFTSRMKSTDEHLTLLAPDLFNMFCQMLVGPDFSGREAKNNDDLFMVSDFGWTIYLPTVGDVEPAIVYPERLFLMKGVPTNKKTEERKHRVRDALTWYRGYREAPASRISESGETFVPRCLTKVINRKEYYASRKDSFILSINYKIHELVGNPPNIVPCELDGSYRYLQECLWDVLVTSPCECSPTEFAAHNELCKFGADMAAGTGIFWASTGEKNPVLSKRIFVALTYSDPRSQWVVLETAIKNSERFTMLRGKNCCVQCTISAAVQRQGKWLVVI